VEKKKSMKTNVFGGVLSPPQQILVLIAQVN
jgi:hypothetical protein